MVYVVLCLGASEDSNGSGFDSKNISKDGPQLI